jgi:hypothetical protein
MNGVIRRHFGKQMTVETKLRFHNITSKSSLSYGSEIRILNRRDTGKPEAAQMRFLRPLLGFTRLDHQRNADIREKLQVLNIVEEIKKYQQNLKDAWTEIGFQNWHSVTNQKDVKTWDDRNVDGRNRTIYLGIHRNRPHGLTLNSS